MGKHCWGPTQQLSPLSRRARTELYQKRQLMCQQIRAEALERAWTLAFRTLQTQQT